MKKRVDYSEIKLDHRKPDLLFLQLEEELRRLFRNITVKADLRLPSTRELAQQLGIDRKTVARAYHGLLEKGFIERKSPKILQIPAAKTACTISQHRHHSALPFFRAD